MAQYSIVADYTGTETITLAEAKAYLRIDSSFTDDDTYITNLIKTARIQVLKDTHQTVVSESITEYFSKWENTFDLAYMGLASSTVVSYYDSANASQTLTEDTDYRVINSMGLPKIEMINTFTLYDRTDAISIGYSCGPTNSQAILPLEIAMYMLIQHYYDNRSPLTYLKVEEMPMGYKNIINKYKNYIW